MIPIDLYEFPWQIFFTILTVLWGACIGSYLNVCVYRIPREISTVKPRSHCPHCKELIPWYRNIPLFTYVSQRGKCSNCGGKIHIRYFLVEALTALLFLLVWLKFDFNAGTRPLGLGAITDWPLVPIYWLFMSGLLLGTFVDFEHLIIPDRVTLGGIVVGLILSAVAPQMHGQETWLKGLMHSGIGAAVGWFSLWGVAIFGTMLFRKEAMGFGDVKLLGAIGAFLGWKAVLFTIVASSLAGSLVGITLVLSRQKEMQSRIPYGPYLALAAMLWVYWGEAWFAWYMGLFSPAAELL